MLRNDLNAKYVDYVQECLHNKRIPNTFSEWHNQKILKGLIRKAHGFKFFSKKMKAEVTVTAYATTKDLALAIAEKKLKALEDKFDLTHDPYLLMSPEQKRIFMLAKMKKEEEKLFALREKKLKEFEEYLKSAEQSKENIPDASWN